METQISIYLLLAFFCASSHGLEKTVYLASSCTADSAAITTSMRIESATGLSYANSMNCRYLISVPTGYTVNAVPRLFQLEHKRSGSCVDYINFYDGGLTATSADLLNSEPYCESTLPPATTSNGTQMTLEFITDSTAKYRGFDIIFAAVRTAPCSSSEYACSNGLCIASSLRCDNLDECGDNSDETQCTQSGNAVDGQGNSALIAGLCIGLGSLILIALLIGLYAYRQYRWKLFLKDPLPVIQQWDNGDNYPVTRKYYKSKYNNFGYQSTEMRVPSRMSNDLVTDDDGEDDIDAMEPVQTSRPISPASSTAKIKGKGKITGIGGTSEA